MTTFVDTSAFYALLNGQDPVHRFAVEGLSSLAGTTLVTHDYVIVEAAALVHRRLGATAARDLLVDLTRPLEIVWIDESIHRRAASAFVNSGANGPSLVDCTSFEVMRARGIRTAFAFDRHFTDAGFAVVPA